MLDDYQHRTYGVERPDAIDLDEVLISADSHVMEPEGLWKREVPRAFKDRAPSFGGPRPDDIKIPAAVDKRLRLAEMAEGNVSAEVLFPTWGIKLLSLDDVELEAVCVRVYNDWLIDYCHTCPDRLLGLALLSVYDINGAVNELRRCRDAGLRGAVVWQAPADGLSFRTDHYDPLWAAAQEMQVPINFHINSGHGYSKYKDRWNGSHQTAMKVHQVMDTLHDLIYSGALERFPDLNIVLAENEIGWVPWALEQWDFTLSKGRTGSHIGPTSTRFYKPEEQLKLMPSEYYHRQVYSTFFNDSVGSRLLSWWGQDNCMWASDFPHGDSSWPNSSELTERDLTDLSAETRSKVVRENVARIYNFAVPGHIRSSQLARSSS